MATRTAGVLKRVVQTVTNVDSTAVSDRELLRRFSAANDQAAFTALVNRHTRLSGNYSASNRCCKWADGRWFWWL